MHKFLAVCKRIITIVHLILIKVLHFNSFYFQGISLIDTTSCFVIEDKGVIKLGKSIGIRRRCEFRVSRTGIIDIGNGVFFNNSCLLVSHDMIRIGNGTRFGPNVMVYDHDYNYKNFEDFKSGVHKTSPIIIGNDCWIGAGVIILKGTKIGNNCVIGAGSLIKGSYSDGSVVVQRRIETVRKY